jgi:hypothetical protein
VANVYPAVDSVPAEENQTEQDTPPRVTEAEQNSAKVHKQKNKDCVTRWIVSLKEFF